MLARTKTRLYSSLSKTSRQPSSSCLLAILVIQPLVAPCQVIISAVIRKHAIFQSSQPQGCSLYLQSCQSTFAAETKSQGSCLCPGSTTTEGRPRPASAASGFLRFVSSLLLDSRSNVQVIRLVNSPLCLMQDSELFLFLSRYA